MERIATPLMLVFALSAATARAADYSGTYTLQTSDGLNTLIIRQDARGEVKGSLKTDDGMDFELSGAVKADQKSIAGMLTSGERGVFFQARLSGQKLLLQLIPAGEDGDPDQSKAQEHVFSRQAMDGSSGASFPAAAPVPDQSAGSNPVATGTQDPFLGTFADSRLTLQLSQVRNGYAGSIQFNGQTFSVTAQKVGAGRIKGRFQSGANSFDFEASLPGSTMTFATGGATYSLQKKSGGPAMQAKSSATAPAADLPPPPTSGGRSLADPYMGIQFTAPNGWKEEKAEGTFVLKSPPHEGAILVVTHSMNSMEELQTTATQPTSFGEGSEMTPSSQPRSLGTNAVAVDYAGNIGGQQAQARGVAVLSPHGGGVTVIYLAESRQYNAQYAALTESIARSLRFSKPQTAPQAQTWANRLKGHRLAYMASGGSSSFGGGYTGWSESKDIYLCSDGTFQSSSSFQGAADTGGGSSGYVGDNPGAQGGRWRITAQGGQPALELRAQHGSTATYLLSMDGNQTLLNGRRYFVVENPVCQ